MKIINYSAVGGLTADTTQITADNIIITADMEGSLGGTIIKIIPRIMVNTVYVKLYNEITFQTILFTSPAVDDRGYLVFAVPTTGIKEQDTFELTVRKDSFDGELIYRDKAYATTVVDLANYKLNYPDINGVIIVN